MGYLSFDAARYWETLPDKQPRRHFENKCKSQDFEFDLYEEGIIFDHIRNRAHYFSSDRVRNRFNEINEIIKRRTSTDSSFPFESSSTCRRNLDEDHPNVDPLHFSKPCSNVSKDEFEFSVAKAKEYIRNGDVFQVVLSKRYEFEFTGDLLGFYSSLRTLNPSPYMYFLDMGETRIVGSSPEMMVRVDQGKIETFPIAGTRPCSENKARNSKLMKELLSDPKERAEHLMLVDLARNDVGRVSEFGSVSVPEFMQVHQYSHVQHIVSHVTGSLRSGLTCFDAMRSIFPAGTVSGAPKIRAMEIIDELEPDPRGPYAGAVGYFSFNGNMDSAITIRTLVACENQASIQAGAGIVADSVPETEWKETERKAAALLRALEISAAVGQEGEQHFSTSAKKVCTTVRSQRERMT